MQENALHFDAEKLQCKVEKIEELIGQIANDEATIKMDGKEFKRMGIKEEEILTPEQWMALKMASLKCSERIDENDEEDWEQISDEEEMEQRMELKLAAEVGQSGPKFNRLNIYDDEYDGKIFKYDGINNKCFLDTYEHVQSYTKVDLGAE